MMTTIEIIKGYQDAYDDAIKRTRAHLKGLQDAGRDDSAEYYFNQGVLRAYNIASDDFKDIFAALYFKEHKKEIPMDELIARIAYMYEQ